MFFKYGTCNVICKAYKLANIPEKLYKTKRGRNNNVRGRVSFGYKDVSIEGCTI